MLALGESGRAVSYLRDYVITNWCHGLWVLMVGLCCLFSCSLLNISDWYFLWIFFFYVFKGTIGLGCCFYNHLFKISSMYHFDLLEEWVSCSLQFGMFFFFFHCYKLIILKARTKLFLCDSVANHRPPCHGKDINNSYIFSFIMIDNSLIMNCISITNNKLYIPVTIIGWRACVRPPRGTWALKVIR